VTPDGTARVVYTGTDGDIHELRLPPGQGWIDADLSALGGGPQAASGPVGYVTPDGTARVVYTAVDGDIHELHLPSGQGWIDADLSALGGGPHAASGPSAYWTLDGTARVVYTGTDSDIHELHLSPGQGWIDADLSALGGGPHASFGPFGYWTPDGPTARVVYTSANGSIHELHLSPGQGWSDAGLPGLGYGTPFGYWTPDGPTARVVYIGGTDVQVHELSLPPGQGWGDANLSDLGGGIQTILPPPSAYVTPDGPTARVVYTGFPDNDIHELSLLPGQGWVDHDISLGSGGPSASSSPFGYVTYDGPTARVVYIGSDGDVHELHLSLGADVSPRPDLTIPVSSLPVTDAPRPGVPADPSPAVPNNGSDRDLYGLRLESGGPTSSGTPLAKALADGLSGSDPAPGRSGQLTVLPLEGLDRLDDLFAS
jgi:hypothetical protein